MLDDLRLAVVGDQIIIFIIPRQKPRTHLIYFSIPSELHFLIHIPLKILELYFHIFGNRIVNEAGEQITLRGTNLGGWLMQEGWMTPLGSGEIDHAFITNITASVTNGEHVAANAIDTVTTNGI